MTPAPVDHRLSLAEVIDELLHRYGNDGDWPADHRCTKGGVSVQATGWDGRLLFSSSPLGYAPGLGYGPPVMVHAHACDHRGVDAPLVDRLAALVEKGTGLARPDGAKQHPARAGSPAPWAAAPAELLMEIWHRSVAFSAELRDELDFRALCVPVVVGAVHGQLITPKMIYIPAATAGEAGGRAALLELPRLVDAAQGMVEAARVAGWIEQQVRAWHRRALLLTGHVVAWTRLDQIPNPDHLASYDRCGLDGGGYLVGPFCLACKHRSCAQLRRGHTQRWVEPACPHCHRSMLRRNPVTQAVHCLSPSCLDEKGKRHVWSIEQWAR